MRDRLSFSARRLYESIVAMEVVDLVTRLTLILFLLSDLVVGGDWWFQAPLRVLAVVGLLVPRLHRSRSLWLLLALVMGAKTLFNWWTQDNHIFLLTYWCLALALSLELRRPSEALQVSSRLLIGLSFGFAMVWKGALSPDFADGSYFHYTFLTDWRFEEFGRVLGGMDEAAWQSNRAAIAQLNSMRVAVEAVDLHGTAQIAGLARLVTYWTLAIEGAGALAFLWPATHRLSRVRHAVLLTFAYTTYLVATVETFGWALLILGLAQCEPHLRRTRFLYVASCLVVLLYGYVPILAFLPPLF